MKTIYLIAFTSLFFCFKSFCQNKQQGVFLSAIDFTNNKITCSPIEEKKYKFHLNEIINSDYLKITIGDSVIKFDKDSLFGYRDNEGNSFRFFNKNNYKIISVNESLVLYTQTTIGGYKNKQFITNYYFSLNTNSPVLPLNKWNLKSAFPSNNVFQELLDMYFNNDDELSTYDNYNNTYKLNIALKLSKQITF